MKRNWKRLNALLLTLVLGVNSMAVPGTAAEAGKPDGASGQSAAYSVSADSAEYVGTDSAGELLAAELAGEQEKDAAQAGAEYRITELEVDGSMAAVHYFTITDAELIVALCEEGTDGMPGIMVAAGKTRVAAGSNYAELPVEAYGEALPDYFIAQAFLTDPENHRPLCDSFSNTMYTRDMQKLLGSTVEDYEAQGKEVLNLDADTSTNFVVYQDEAVVLAPGSYTATDLGGGTYRICPETDECEELLQTLEEGTALVCEHEDGTVLLIKVAGIESDGDGGVTVRKDTDATLDDFFGDVKIHGVTSADSWTVDEKEAEAATDSGIMPAADIEMGEESEFQLNSGFLEGSSFALTPKGTVDYYKSGDYRRVIAKLDYSLKLRIRTANSESKNIIPLKFELPELVGTVLPGVLLKFSPEIALEIQGYIEFELTGTFGSACENGRFHNLSTPPEFNPADTKFETKIYIGINLVPHASIIDEDLADAALKVSVGLEATVDQTLGPGKDQLHDCGTGGLGCAAGDLSLRLAVSAEIHFTDLVNWNQTFGELKFHLLDFYFCIPHNKFEWTTCPYISYRVETTVKDENGKPVEGATVTAWKKDNTEQEVQTEDGSPAVTDQDGRVDLFLPNGRYELRAETLDLTGTATQWTVVKDLKTKSEIEMKAKEYRVQIQAVDEENEEIPVKDVDVTVAGKSLLVRTDSDGIAKMSLPSGTYEVKLEKETEDGLWEAKATLTVDRMDTKLIVPMKKVRYGTVAISVADETGAPVSGAFIEGVSDDGNKYSGYTNSSGRVDPKLKIGDYTFTATKDNLMGKASSTVKEGENPDITITMEECSVLRLTAVDESGKPVLGARIEGLGSALEPTTDLNGQAEIKLLNGSYHLKVYTETLIGYADVTVAGEDIDLQVTLKRILAVLHLTAVDTNGEPVSGAQVSGLGLDTEPTTDANGQAEIELEDGSYRVQVRAENMVGYAKVTIDGEDVNLTITMEESNIFWDMDDNGVLRIYGRGDMPDYEGINSRTSAPWAAYVYDITSVIIEEGITSIGEYAFYGCRNMKNASLPEGLVEIKKDGFGFCGNLADITFPVELERIGDYAFSTCNGLTDVRLPSHLKIIGASAFGSCANLKEITIPESVAEIGEGAFNYDEGLKKASILGNPDFGIEIFRGSGLEEVYLADSVTSIGYAMFKDCTLLPEITLPAALEKISVGAFSKCTSLHSIYFRSKDIPECTGNVSSYLRFPPFENVTATVYIPYSWNREHFDESCGGNLTYVEYDPEADPSVLSAAAMAVVASEETESASPAWDGELSLTLDMDAETFEAAETAETAGVEPAGAQEPGAGTALPETEGLISEGEADDDEAVSADALPESDAIVAGEDVYAASTVILERSREVFAESESSGDVFAAAFTGLSPGMNYIFAAVIDLDAQDLMAPENLLYIAQGKADADGGVTFRYRTRTGEEGQQGIYDSAARPLADAVITVEALKENGKIQTPRVTVVCDGKELEEDVDYLLTGDTRVLDAGDYSLTLIGINAYAGRVTKTFRVEPSGTSGACAEHDMGEWIAGTRATVFAAATQKRTCRVCGYVETRSYGSRLTPTIRLNAYQIPLKVKQSTTKVKVSGLAAGDYVVSWKSSKPKVVKVSKSGRIKAGKKTGKATVTVTLASGKTARVVVKVQKKKVRTKKIGGIRSTLVLREGETRKLSPTVTPITSREKVRYKSSKKKVVSVSKKGVVKARKKGHAVITVRSGRRKVRCKVIVR